MIFLLVWEKHSWKWRTTIVFTYEEHLSNFSVTDNCVLLKLLFLQEWESQMWKVPEDTVFLFLLFLIIRVISLNCEFFSVVITVSIWILLRNTFFKKLSLFLSVWSSVILVLLIHRTSQWLVVDGFVSIQLRAGIIQIMQS